MIESIWAILAGFGVALLRSTAGWAEKAVADDKITKFEWRQLVQTTIRVTVLNAAFYFGLEGAGVDAEPLATGFAALLTDIFFRHIKNW